MRLEIRAKDRSESWRANRSNLPCLYEAARNPNHQQFQFPRLSAGVGEATVGRLSGYWSSAEGKLGRERKKLGFVWSIGVIFAGGGKQRSMRLICDLLAFSPRLPSVL